jgi:hypothetical protein
MRQLIMLLAVFLVLIVGPALAVVAIRRDGDPPPPSALVEEQVPDFVDPYPNYPPLSELKRLPAANVAADWMKLQRKVIDEAKAKLADPKLELRLQVAYERLMREVARRMGWCNKIIAAHDTNLGDYWRKNCLAYLSGVDAYYTGCWPEPVPTELIRGIEVLRGNEQNKAQPQE